MTIKNWNIEELTGYKPITTYYTDFSIADKFGLHAIKDTFKRCIKNYINYKYLTELVMALNWKIWEHYNKNEKLAELYNDLWQQAQDFAYNTLKGQELTYFIRTID